MKWYGILSLLVVKPLALAVGSVNSRMIAEEFFGNELMKLGKTKMLDYSHGAHGRVALYEGNLELHLKEEY